jgi:NAD(P)-dependent dehydrogenase (short-subunit alcohol dehydrogenase family)
LAAVHQAAARILANHPGIDILVNNAGVMGVPEQRTEDGCEMQLGVNHLGLMTTVKRPVVQALRWVRPAVVGLPNGR